MGAGGVGRGVVSAGVEGAVLGVTVVSEGVVSASASQSQIFSSSFQTRLSGQGMSYAMPASLH